MGVFFLSDIQLFVSVFSGSVRDSGNGSVRDSGNGKSSVIE